MIMIETYFSFEFIKPIETLIFSEDLVSAMHICHLYLGLFWRTKLCVMIRKLSNFGKSILKAYFLKQKCD